MNARLTRALTEGERYTPDPDVVLAGVRTGIARSRRRRRYATAGLAGLAVLALTGTAVVVDRSERSSPRPAGSPAPPAVPAQACGLSFGWLPEGLDEPTRDCGPRRQSVLYPMAGGPYLAVSIDQSAWQGYAKIKPGWKPVTVNGRNGQIVTRRTRTFIRFPLPSGHWVFLEYGVGQPSGKATTGLAPTAQRIAEHISEAPAGSLTVPFAPTYLPSGQRLDHIGQGAGGATASVGYQDGSGRIVGSGTATTEDGVAIEKPYVDTGIGYGISWSSDPRNVINLAEAERAMRTERTVDVQGSRAYLINQGDVLVVESFHGGQLTVSVNLPIGDPRNHPPRPSNVSQELLRIAEGVRWLG
ncbi:hypothetical protein ACGFI9_29650 [Micromonospora sp. NPDC048930]|uniref:hypothetical protein n=1 Tax=Micromonospora sp. NPDC048930 TaxID=3364261 RepID=UPI003717D5E6